MDAQKATAAVKFKNLFMERLMANHSALRKRKGAARGVASPKGMRRRGRVVEGARLESEYTSKAYRGFESLRLRHLVKFIQYNDKFD